MYFNHAFTKLFLGTQVSGVAPLNPNPNLTNGFLTLAGVPSLQLGNIDPVTAGNNYGPGSYGFFTPDNFLSVDLSFVQSNTCCPLVLASASLLHSDKIGPFHGGYKESNKSKKINPKFIQHVYRVDACTPQQAVVHVGSTNWTNGTGIATHGPIVAGTETYVNGVYPNINLLGGSGIGAKATVTVAGNAVTLITITNPGTGYQVADVLTLERANIPTPGALTILVAGSGTTTTVATLGPADLNCCKQFYCGENYYIRIDVKGSPALRFANHNIYRNLLAEGGCCPGPTPTLVDPTGIMIQWATAIINDPYLQQLISPIVFDYTGVPWFATGADAVAAGWPSTQTFDNYASSAQAAAWVDTAPGCAGIRLVGAYVETKFGNCTFQVTDFFEKQPVTILVSEVDLNGDPCVFEGLCVVTECPGTQGMGFGEQVVRDLILSESYLQNFFASTDLRIREITQGYDILNSVNRNALYTRYFIAHSVPRYNNPTGVFDNDRYVLEIISTGVNAALETFLSTWLSNCADCVTLEVKDCTPCVIVPVPVPVG